MASWNAELVVEEAKVFSPKDADGSVKRKKNGDPLTVFSVKRTIELTRGHLTISFPVSRGKGGHPVITDRRECSTGAAPLTLAGPCPGEEFTKSGRARKLTPTGWAADVEHLIGPAAVGRIFVALVNEGFTAG